MTRDDVVLKPCPFCGGTNLVRGGDDKIVAVFCGTCGSCGPDEYGSSNNWNTRASPSASADRGGWQPISTAPKDGTPVLAYGFCAGEINGPGDTEHIEVATYSGPGGDWPGFDWDIASDAYANWMAPSHWQPLPEPPALQQKGEETCSAPS